MSIVYKICSKSEWDNAVIEKIYTGSEVDNRDGFIHLSTKEQLKEIQKFLNKKGETLVHINYSNDNEKHCFKLKNPRNIDRKSINILRNKEISLNIH